MLAGYVPLGDSNETCQSGLAGEHVVERIVEALVRHIKADMKEPSIPVVEEFHIHAACQSPGLLDYFVSIVENLPCQPYRRGKSLPQVGDPGSQWVREICTF